MSGYLKITFFISIIIFLISCKTEKELEKEKLERNLRTFYIENYKDSTSTLDSLRLLKIDTITQAMFLLEQSKDLFNQFEILSELYSLNTKSLSNSVDQLNLYKMVYSPDLVAIEKKML
jgi:hypothetical protein